MRSQSAQCGREAAAGRRRESRHRVHQAAQHVQRRGAGDETLGRRKDNTHIAATLSPKPSKFRVRNAARRLLTRRALKMPQDSHSCAACATVSARGELSKLVAAEKFAGKKHCRMAFARCRPAKRCAILCSYSPELVWHSPNVVTERRHRSPCACWLRGFGLHAVHSLERRHARARGRVCVCAAARARARARAPAALP